MKKVLLALLLGLGASAARAAQTGCFYDLRGEVSVQKGGAGGWRSALKGEALAEGDKVRTGGSGACDLLMKDGTFVKVDPGSEASVESLVATKEERTFSFSLLKGKALWMVAKLKKDLKSSFRVRTPSAVCAVRGTDFATVVSSSGVLDLGLFDGQVAVSATGAEKVLLPGGQLTAGEAGLEAQDRLGPAMRAEERRCRKLKAHVEALRKRLAERDDYIDDYIGRQNKALSDREEKLRKRLEGRGADPAPEQK